MGVLGADLGGVSIDLGGASMATRMVGGFILVAFLFSILLAWPGRRRWPLWLIGGLCVSVSGALAFAISPVDSGWVHSLQAVTLAMAVGFVATATVRDLRDPTR